MTNSRSHNITKSHTYLRSVRQSQHILSHTHAHSHTRIHTLTSNLVLPELVHPLRIKTCQMRCLTQLIYIDITEGQNVDRRSAVFVQFTESDRTELAVNL